jgi:hypothetical protein
VSERDLLRVVGDAEIAEQWGGQGKREWGRRIHRGEAYACLVQYVCSMWGVCRVEKRHQKLDS